MEGLREFLETVRRQKYAEGNFLGLLHIVIGRKITTADGNLIANGVTWRQLADLLKKLRWDRDAVQELGLDPEALAVRDRQRYWYQAIAAAHVDSPQARKAGDQLAAKLASVDYVVGPAPGGG